MPSHARRRASTVVLFPLLVLLHLAFTLSSLLYRLVQTLRRRPPAARPSVPPPRHVAVSFALPPRARGGALSGAEEERLVECVRGAMRGAAEWGVDELSVWDVAGHAYGLHARALRDTLDLPPSPPSSSPSTPPASPEPPEARVLPASKSTISVTVRPLTSDGPRALRVHFLHSSAADAIAASARALAHLPPAALTQPQLDAEVRRALGVPDPDLLIVHALSPPAGWRAALPRPAPELHAYPPWLLRLTEIYARPAPFPFPHALDAPAALLRASHLPILRKIGAAVPADPADRPDPGSGASTPSASPDRYPGQGRSTKRGRDGPGVLGPETWAGAREAWARVEQRLGK
ncbi:hypothetical protein Q5752_006586 [Cryptotrichosporon argae]